MSTRYDTSTVHFNTLSLTTTFSLLTKCRTQSKSKYGELSKKLLSLILLRQKRNDCLPVVQWVIFYFDELTLI